MDSSLGRRFLMSNSQASGGNVPRWWRMGLQISEMAGLSGIYFTLKDWRFPKKIAVNINKTAKKYFFTAPKPGWGIAIKSDVCRVEASVGGNGKQPTPEPPILWPAVFVTNSRFSAVSMFQSSPSPTDLCVKPSNYPVDPNLSMFSANSSLHGVCLPFIFHLQIAPIQNIKKTEIWVTQQIWRQICRQWHSKKIQHENPPIIANNENPQTWNLVGETREKMQLNRTHFSVGKIH